MIRGPFSVETAKAFWDAARWPNFSVAELECQCGCGEVLWDEDLMDDAQAIRNSLSHGLIITSGYRCPDHNDSVSSTGLEGPHTKGAFDLGVMGGVAVECIKIATSRGVTGIGVNQKGAGRFIHIDRLENDDGCPRPWMWSY
jgi:zinc D-Ala-D-Ala carboxypeptidase